MPRQLQPIYNHNTIGIFSSYLHGNESIDLEKAALPNK